MAEWKPVDKSRESVQAQDMDHGSTQNFFFHYVEEPFLRINHDLTDAL